MTANSEWSHNPLCSAAGGPPCPIGCEAWTPLSDEEWELFCEGAGIDPYPDSGSAE